MRRMIAIVVLVGAAAAAAVLTAASGGPSGTGKTYKIVFDNAFGLTEGGDLRIGGVKAGTTPQFAVSFGEPHRAIVYAKINKPGFGALRSDAFCSVRQQSLIGEYYVDCQPGTAGKILPNGATIPVTQTASTIPLDLINDIMRRPYRERFRLIIAELGTGLAGRPADLAATLRRSDPGLRETIKTLDVLNRQNRTIRDFIQKSDTVIAELAKNKKDVARFVRTAGRTAAISASRRTELAAGFRKFPTFLAELRPTMARLGELSDAQYPLLIDLQRAAPSLNTFFSQLGPFAQASRPSFRSLGRLSIAGQRALIDSRPEVAQLRSIGRDAQGVGLPLRQLLQTLDDRSRAPRPDPRAKDTAPPAPDFTSGNPGRGFTGMESLANYLYWQSLSINGFDNLSHFLRVVGIESVSDGRGGPGCSPYAAGDIQESTIRACNSYLGPYQPGVIHNPYGPNNDPTAHGSSARASAASSGGRGGPVAKPLPGQPDLSQPQVALSPGAQAMLKGLTAKGARGPAAPAPAAGGQGSDQQMLDYLLGP